MSENTVINQSLARNSNSAYKRTLGRALSAEGISSPSPVQDTARAIRWNGEIMILIAALGRQYLQIAAVFARVSRHVPRSRPDVRGTRMLPEKERAQRAE